MNADEAAAVIRAMRANSGTMRERAEGEGSVSTAKRLTKMNKVLKDSICTQSSTMGLCGADELAFYRQIIHRETRPRASSEYDTRSLRAKHLGSSKAGAVEDGRRSRSEAAGKEKYEDTASLRGTEVLTRGTAKLANDLLPSLFKGKVILQPVSTNPVVCKLSPTEKRHNQCMYRDVVNSSVFDWSGSDEDVDPESGSLTLVMPIGFVDGLDRDPGYLSEEEKVIGAIQKQGLALKPPPLKRRLKPSSADHEIVSGEPASYKTMLARVAEAPTCETSHSELKSWTYNSVAIRSAAANKVLPRSHPRARVMNIISGQPLRISASCHRYPARFGE